MVRAESESAQETGVDGARRDNKWPELGTGVSTEHCVAHLPGPEFCQLFTWIS